MVAHTRFGVLPGLLRTVQPLGQGRHEQPRHLGDRRRSLRRDPFELTGSLSAFAASLNSSGHPGQPVIMAELKQPGFEAFAQAEVAKLSTGTNAQKVRIVTDASAERKSDTEGKRAAL